MTRNDFMVGQTVYLKTISSLYECWKNERFITGVVTKVGRKYITVQDGPFREYRFNIANDFRQETQYSPEYQLFLSERSVYKYWQSKYLKFEIEKKFARYGNSIDLRTLERIAKELNIPIESMREE